MGKKTAVKKARKGTGSKALGHFAEMTEDFERHDVGKKKHKDVSKAHREEYSAAHSHSMAHTEMFRSHAGSQHHQEDLRNVEKHMGIKVNVRHYGKEAAKERAAAEKASAKAKELAEKKRDAKLYLEVRKSSPMYRSRPDSIGGPGFSAASPSVGARKPITVPRPYSLSSPRVKNPATTPDEEALRAHSPARSSQSNPNVVKYTAVEPTGRIATAERILNEQMIRLKTLIIRAHAQKTSHDQHTILSHAHDRASALVKQEVKEIQQGLDELQGPSPLHKYTAFSTMYVRLNKDLESVLLNDDHVHKKHLSYEQKVREQEKERQLDGHLADLASKDQRLNQLQKDLEVHAETNESLARTNEALSKELEKLHRNNVMANQNAVELRMQGLDFKARVENRLSRVLHSISTRMGFIPAGIIKEMDALRGLKAPGDPEYNDVLHQAYTKNSLKKMQRMLGDIPAISGMFDESDVLVDPYTGKMTLLDGTPVADKTEAAQQEAKDRLRMTGYSPARKGKSDVNINIPTVSGGSVGTGSTSLESDLQNRSELIEAGTKSQSLLPPRSPKGARAIEGRNRAPRSQEDWIKWALNATDIEIPLSPASRAAAGTRPAPMNIPHSFTDMRKASVASSTWAEPPTEDESSGTAPAGEIELKTYQDFADDMDDEEDSDYYPEQDDEDSESDSDSDSADYLPEEVVARQEGRFYELESVSTQGIDEDTDQMSYEAGKSKTAEAIANAAGGSTYIDPRASIRSSVSSFGEDTFKDALARGGGLSRPAWKDPSEDVTAGEINKTETELSDIRAFLQHVRNQRGIAEAELAPYLTRFDGSSK